MRALIVLFALVVVGQLWPAYGQSQLNLTQSSGDEYAKADRQLNEVYQRILKEYAADPVFITNLREAQRAWIKFRDAEVSAKYPEREPGYYGSSHAMCRSSFLAELTNQRTKQLRVWLTGIQEGDVCSGSVKMKQ